jgi:hypothetical protein
MFGGYRDKGDADFDLILFRGVRIRLDLGHVDRSRERELLDRQFMNGYSAVSDVEHRLCLTEHARNVLASLRWVGAREGQ